ncbi:hypothetical protein Tco_0495152, partial [Tanacetum coccineum]
VNVAGTKDADVNSTNSIYTASLLVNFDGLSYFNVNPTDDPKMPNLEYTGIFGGAYDDEDFCNTPKNVCRIGSMSEGVTS